MTEADKLKREGDPAAGDDSSPPSRTFRLPDAAGDPDTALPDVGETWAAEPLGEPVGEELRRTRESFDQTLADVAASLNIRHVYLQALEDGDFDKLPGATYAVGFLRSYAEYLGLDSKDLARRFKEEMAGRQDATQLVFPVPASDSRLPGAALILVSLVLCALAYGTWSFITKPEPQVAELVPAVPNRLQGLLDEEVPPGGANGAEPETAAATVSGSEVSAKISLADGGAEDVQPAAVPENGARDEAVPGGAADEPTPAATFEVPAYEAAPLAEAENLAAREPDPAPLPQLAPEAGRQSETAPTSSAVEATAPRPADSPAAAAEPEAAESVSAAPKPPAPAAPEAAGGEVAAASPLPIPKPPVIDAAPATAATQTAARTREPRIYGAENDTSRITLRASQDSWVQVRAGADELLLTRVLQAGDTYLVPDRLGITLQTGNAGGLDVLVDGRNLGSLGPVGSVRRNVELEVDRLVSGATQR